MQIHREGEEIEVILFGPEISLLEGIISKVMENYAIPPAEMDAATREQWYPRPTGKLDSDAEESLSDAHYALYGVRSERLELLGRIKEFLSSENIPIIWKSSPSDLEVFMTVMNDHRLFLAGEYGVGEDEMDLNLDDVEDGGMRGALLEIYFLGLVLDLCIQALGDF